VHAAESLGVAPESVLKTLMAQVDGKPVCVIVQSDREVRSASVARRYRPKRGQAWGVIGPPWVVRGES